ncbi:helicase-related protein [Curvivirga aplysinae]|uniref:helicase-related protein n=1 Tax=Curvivirga aplysinae TaxID=2529852 RepID=UPI0012BBF4A5|nr:helicase-related protein [Curvivirga aplysinae]MTI10613.1 disulfide oxidoreductase [Curvivirga aplysinae]
MSILDSSRSRIRAILGPTNTGKTHLAMERMQAYESGMIGFPLRLLARENYDRLVAVKGASSVALITGEEKIIPHRPKWFICTVESMPVSEPVDFVAIDEIQLCEDRDRGHIFTDRLLHARGRYETMFLGSDSMADLITQLVEDVEIESRPRLSTLSYTGRQKLTRLPRRTAIVAFSVNEVYAIAETIRQHRGGTAVVLGALSPRTRNAQVAMYQAGEVDYLVATDAIGMGLNMDVDHVAFASMRKYDGHKLRPLRPWEIGQIAGRAGRHMNDGTFGVTNNLPEIDDDVVELVERHEFTPITHIQWRNRNLDFRNTHNLLRSLQKNPNSSELLRTRDATDHVALQMMMKDEAVLLRATTPDRVQLLWDVCQVPDFRKITPDHHTEFLTRLYLNLVDHGAVPEDLMEERLSRLDNTQGDIDQLTQRLAHIRSWAYVMHRSSWLRHSYEWQERARSIEDKISDALHQSLMLRFVDKRAALISKKDKGEGREHVSAVDKAGVISIEGHIVGRMVGFHFQADRAKDRREAKQLAAAASNSIAKYVQDKSDCLINSADAAFRLTPFGHIAWSDPTEEGGEFNDIARLIKGENILSPKLLSLSNDITDNAIQRAILSRMEEWLKAYLSRKLIALEGPKLSDGDAKLSAYARGLVFQLKEGLGSVNVKAAKEQLEGLTESERKMFGKSQLRFGVYWVFWKRLLNGDMLRLRALLYAVYHKITIPTLPRKAQICLPYDYVSQQAWSFIGYIPAGPVVLRLDHYEAVMAHIRRESKNGVLEKNERLADRISCTLQELPKVLRALGCREVETEDGKAFRLIANNVKASKDKKQAQPNKSKKPNRKKQDVQRALSQQKKGQEPHSDKKMGRDMVALQQVTDLAKDTIIPPSTKMVSEDTKSTAKFKKHRSNHSQAQNATKRGNTHKRRQQSAQKSKSKVNPNSPFAGLKDLLEAKGK